MSTVCVDAAGVVAEGVCGAVLEVGKLGRLGIEPVGLATLAVGVAVVAGNVAGAGLCHCWNNKNATASHAINKKVRV